MDKCNFCKTNKWNDLFSVFLKRDKCKFQLDKTEEWQVCLSIKLTVQSVLELLAAIVTCSQLLLLKTKTLSFSTSWKTWFQNRNFKNKFSRPYQNSEHRKTNMNSLLNIWKRANSSNYYLTKPTAIKISKEFGK